MAESKKADAISNDGSKNPSIEEQAAALKAAGVSPAADTAAGIAARGTPEKVKHEGKGGEGSAEVHDTILKPGKATGAQTEPALMTPSGSIPHNTVPTPTGLVPASVGGDAVEEALEAQRESIKDAHRGRTGRYRLSDEFVEGMTPAELRAVAADRGYDVGEGGRRALRGRFLAEQAEDEGLEDPPKDSPFAAPTKRRKASE